MISNSAANTLRASAALAAAGADQALTEIEVTRADYLTLKILYTGASASGALGLRVKWKTVGGNTTAAHGSLLSGTAIAKEAYTFSAPGSSVQLVQLVTLIVPAGVEKFAGLVYESGDTSNPGTLVVEAWTGRNHG